MPASPCIPMPAEFVTSPCPPSLLPNYFLKHHYNVAVAGIISRPNVSSGVMSWTLGMLKIAC